jgi:GT2 family glycosyltransferase
LSRSSSPFDRQNELIRSLHRQLEATERELASQKWLFEKFLQSPSWRLTFPLRWIAKQVRAIREWFIRRPSSTEAAESRPDPQTDAALIDAGPPGVSALDSPLNIKQFFTELYSLQLQSFLAADSTLSLPHSDRPEVSVILVLYNRAELTFACLRSLTENHTERMEIILVDNASQDQTLLLLDRLRGARVIRNLENRNFLLAVNQAAKEARGEHLLLLNNDAQLLPGSLQSALRAIRSATDIGAVGGRLILLDGTLQEAGSILWRDGSCLGYGRGDNPFAPMYMFRRDVDYCSGAFLLTPRRIWEDLGGFDEAFKPAYYEETDYCARLWQRGLRVVYDPNSVLLHYEFASSESARRAVDLQAEHQRVFAARHRSLLATRLASDVNAILPARTKEHNVKRVLFIDDQAPHSWLGSGFPRARAILLTLLKQGYFVTFYPLSVIEESWSSVYSDMPGEIEFIMGYGLTLLEPFLRNRPRYYETVFISRPHNMEKVKPLLEAHPDWFEAVHVVYDAEAIFAAREITLRQLSGTSLSDEDADTLMQSEIDLASAADCVAAVSKLDAGRFREHGIENVCVIGHSLSAEPTTRGFEQRQGFLFVGAIHEEASPNGDSIIWFLEEVLPKIRDELGNDIPIIIAGVNKSERVRTLASPGVQITGEMPDLTDLYDNARVFVAPTRYAAGIPHKVHEAAARGVPIVATPLLASQLGWQDGNPFLVAADANEFAAKCVELHRNCELWAMLREAALARIRTECSAETFEEAVKDCVSHAGVRLNVGMDR